MHRGYIKAWRKILSSSMYKRLTASQRDLMWVCLLSANHEIASWEWQSKIISCQPGQFITSLASLKNKCAKDTSIKNIRTGLLKLEKWQFLANKPTKTGRLITIMNWKAYQDVEIKTAKRTAKRRQRGGKEAASNKNDKNDKNKEIKTRFLDYVDLKDTEFETLKKKHGEDRANRMVEVLNDYFVADVKRLKKYTSHYGAINSWVAEKVLEKMPMQGISQNNLIGKTICRDCKKSPPDGFLQDGVCNKCRESFL